MSSYIEKSINLVTFAGYTGGGILCDILNLESSQIGKHNNIYNNHHALGKIQTENWHTGRGYDCNDFYEKVERHAVKSGSRQRKLWLGTHCWPGDFDTEKFDTILNVTTETRNSKMLRHCRVFYTTLHGLFPDWQFKRGKTKPQLLEEVIEFNQSYNAVSRPNVINLEFENVVNCDDIFKSTMLKYIGSEYLPHLEKRMNVWKELNPFLYDERLNYIKNLWEKNNI
jgi:hypothetical protein